MAVTNFDLTCTDCVLTEGFQPPCKPDSLGGNDADIYIISACNVTSTEDAYDNNIVTDITLDGSAFWYQIKANPDTIEVTETKNIQTGGTSYNLTFQISALADSGTTDAPENAAAARSFVEAVTNPYEKFMVVITANHGNGVRYLYGESSRALRISEASYASGATDEDVSNFTLTFGGSGILARPLATSVTLPTS